jgi:flagellar protein FlaJ
MHTGFKTYVGLLFFTSIVAAVGAFAITLVILVFLNVADFLVFALVTGLLAWAVALVIGYYYPKLVAQDRGNKIDANLPIIANFMSVLASSGMPPEGIFHSLARVGDEFKIGKEARGVIRDIGFLGMDLHTAVKTASETAPSRKLAAMLDGFVTTSTMGGDMATYLRLEADKHKRERMLKMRRFLDNLGVIAEAYIAFMVAAPIMIIVMLSVMAFLGGGGFTIANIDPAMMLNLLTFIILPIGIAIMIYVVDSMIPMR